MNRILYSLVLISFLSLGHLSAQDSCEEALQIELGLTVVPEITGTDVPEIFCGFTAEADQANWYRYSATDDFAVRLTSNLPDNGNTDTRVNVYRDNCDDLLCVGGDDDGGDGFTSTVDFSVEAGESYLISWDDRWTSAGFTFSLDSLDTPPPPAEGSFAFTQVSTSLQGSPASIVDMNGDHLDDLLGISGSTVHVGYQQTDGSFIYESVETPAPGHSPSWSLSAADINGNGRTDLLYGGGSGATFMFAREDGQEYEEYTSPDYIFCQRTNFVDINSDGDLDAFTCHDVQPNCYFINDGNAGMEFFQGGLGETSNGGNYGSVWSDFDNDGDVDLFLSKCRGGDSPANINQLHINNGDGTFMDMAPSAGLADDVLTWSSAIADFDNDGDMDIFVGASSSSNGLHKMMQNNMDGTFSDVTEGTGIEFHTSTSTEHFAYDFDNDGYVDIYSTNQKILKNNGDMTFSIVSVVPNTGAVGDVNSDGFLDMINGSTVHLNNGNDNHHLTVNLVGTESNKDGIGARVTVTSALGSQIRDIYSGIGFRYMHSLNAYFGLGEDEAIESVTIQWPSGIVDVIENPAIDGQLIVVEGSSPLSVDEEYNALFSIYPTLAAEAITINTQESLSGALMSVFDLSGKRVMNGAVTDTRIDVSGLAKGGYILRLEIDGQFVKKRFIKE